MIYIKNSAKGIIIRNSEVLLLEKRQGGDVTYTLPGGTQEPGEPLEKTVVREVFEETNAQVEVLGLLAIYEHHRTSQSKVDIKKHKVEFAFLCQVDNAYQPQMGEKPDSNQVAVKWVGIDSLPELSLNPARLSDIISDESVSSNLGQIYLGNID